MARSRTGTLAKRIYFERMVSSSFVVAILYGFLGVTITNLCALTGLICIPIRRSRYYDLLITFMIALAVGALFSTALLVLIPEVCHLTLPTFYCFSATMPRVDS